MARSKHCTYRPERGPHSHPRDCTNRPDFEVKDGDVKAHVCTRHLTDAIEEAVRDSCLTYHDGPLEVRPLRETEND